MAEFLPDLFLVFTLLGKLGQLFRLHMTLYGHLSTSHLIVSQFGNHHILGGDICKVYSVDAVSTSAFNSVACAACSLLLIGQSVHGLLIISQVYGHSINNNVSVFQEAQIIHGVEKLNYYYFAEHIPILPGKKIGRK